MNNLYGNIKALCKKSHIKISDIEKPYTAGTMSRHEKTGMIASLPIGMVYKASQMLGVSIEDLIEKDFAKDLEIEQIEREIRRLQAKLEEVQNCQ